MTWERGIAIVVGAIVVAAGAGVAGAAPSGRDRATGTHNFRGELRMVSALGDCPPGVTASACANRTAEGLIPGLGRVSTTYTFLASIGPPSCPDGSGKTLGYVVRLAVAGKGEIELALAEGGACIGTEAVRAQTQTYTITAATGTYAGASGGGTVERIEAGETNTGARVFRETWSGTLSVPNLEFDLVPPTLTGATPKTVRAPRRATRIRVTYAVTARDDVDGAVAVSCTPRSGTRFRIGRTLVTCTATDASGNTRTARFTITVRRRR